MNASYWHISESSAHSVSKTMTTLGNYIDSGDVLLTRSTMVDEGKSDLNGHNRVPPIFPFLQKGENRGSFPLYNRRQMCKEFVDNFSKVISCFINNIQNLFESKIPFINQCYLHVQVVQDHTDFRPYLFHLANVFQLYLLEF